MTLLVLTVVLAVVFVASGGMKVVRLPYSERNRDRFAITPARWQTLGMLELAGVVGLFVGLAVPALGIAAAVGLALVMVGAVVYRIRLRDPLNHVLGDVVVLALVVAYIVVRA